MNCNIIEEIWKYKYDETKVEDLLNTMVHNFCTAKDEDQSEQQWTTLISESQMELINAYKMNVIESQEDENLWAINTIEVSVENGNEIEIRKFAFHKANIEIQPSDVVQLVQHYLTTQWNKQVTRNAISKSLKLKQFVENVLKVETEQHQGCTEIQQQIQAWLWQNLSQYSPSLRYQIISSPKISDEKQLKIWIEAIELCHKQDILAKFGVMQPYSEAESSIELPRISQEYANERDMTTTWFKYQKTQFRKTRAYKVIINEFSKRVLENKANNNHLRQLMKSSPSATLLEYTLNAIEKVRNGKNMYENGELMKLIESVLTQENKLNMVGSLYNASPVDIELKEDQVINQELLLALNQADALTVNVLRKYIFSHATVNETSFGYICNALNRLIETKDETLKAMVISLFNDVIAPSAVALEVKFCVLHFAKTLVKSVKIEQTFIENVQQLASSSATNSYIRKIAFELYGLIAPENDTFIIDELLSSDELLNVKRSAAEALIQMVDSQDKIPLSVSQKYNELVQITVNAEKIINQRPVAIAVMLLLVKCSLIDKKLISQQFNPKKLFIKVVANFLLNEDSIKKCCPRDYPNLAELVVLLVKNYANQLKLKSNESILTALFVVSSNVVSYEARSIALEGISTIIEQKPTMAEQLFKGFVKYLNTLANNYYVTRIFNRRKSAFLGKTLLQINPSLTMSKNKYTLAIATAFHHPILAGNHGQWLDDVHTLNTRPIATFVRHTYLSNYETYWFAYLAQNCEASTFIQNNASTCVELIEKAIDEFTSKPPVENVGEALMNTIGTAYFMGSIFAGQQNTEVKQLNLFFKSFTDGLNQHFIELKAFSDTDFEIYNTSPDTVQHNLNEELSLNPIYRGVGDDTKLSPYNLTRQEWNQISKDESNKKKKNPQMDLNDIRLELLTTIYLKREAKIRHKIAKIVETLKWKFTMVQAFIGNERGQKLLQSNVSFFVFPLVQFFDLPISELVATGFLTYAQLADKIVPRKSQFLASIITRAVLRFRNESVDDTKVNEDNDQMFAQKVVSLLRLAGTFRPETFSLFMPFLEYIFSSDAGHLHLPSAVLTIGMSILASHAGLDGVRSGVLLPVIVSTLVHIINLFPNLSRKATLGLSSLMNSLKPVDISPLLNGLLSENATLRSSIILEALPKYQPLGEDHINSQQYEVYKDYDVKLVAYLFFAKFDIEHEKHRKQAEVLLNRYFKHREMKLDYVKSYDELKTELYPLLFNSSPYVRMTTAKAFEDLMQHASDQQKKEFLDSLIELYNGHIENVDVEKSLDTLHGISTFIGNVPSTFTNTVELKTLINWLIEAPLNVKAIRDSFSEAGLNVVNTHGESHGTTLLHLFEVYLKEVSKKNSSERSKAEYIVGTIVIYLGTVGKFLKSDKEKVILIVDRLIETLSMKSESVQESISKTLEPLLSQLESEVIDERMNILCSRMLGDNSHTEKRGAIYGVTAVINAHGFPVFKRYNLLALADKRISKSPKDKQTSLLIYEVFAKRIGWVIDAFAVEMVPNIIQVIADQNQDVQRSADKASKEIMQHVSGSAIHMVISGVIDSLSDEKASWRQKEAGVRLLGNMAYCAPRMLSKWLSKIVAVLQNTMHEPQRAIQVATEKALERVGSCVQSPEIKRQVPLLIEVLKDPQKKMEMVLDQILFTRFSHSIDPAAMALLMPVISRGLTSRDRDTKQKSAQIIGSISLLASDKNTMSGYIESVLPRLREIIMDNHPSVRKAAAKAVGSLVKSVDSLDIDELVGWVHTILQNEKNNAVNREGAARVLSEMVAAQGIDALNRVLPEILEFVHHDVAKIREGYLRIFAYLPSMMVRDFKSVLADSIPIVLEGLSDEDEDVRTICFEASTILIDLYADSAIDLVVPGLKEGLLHIEWRTRQSSIILLGKFFQKLTFTNAAPKLLRKLDRSEAKLILDLKTIETVIPVDEIDEILSYLYFLLHDEQSPVKGEATTVWRHIVGHQGRMIRRILRPVVDLTLRHIANPESDEHRMIASRAIGELIGRLGEQVMADVIPLLADRLKRGDVETRQGVCLCLTELVKTCPGKLLKNYVHRISPCVKRSIMDKEDVVQDAAATTFDVMARICGRKQVIEIIDSMIQVLTEDPDKQLQVTEGLKKLVEKNAEFILEKVFPPILESETLSSSDVYIIAAIASSSAQHLVPHLKDILRLLLKSVATSSYEKVDEELLQNQKSEHSPAIRALVSSCLSVHQNDELLRIFLSCINDHISNNLPNLRRAAMITLQIFLITGSKFMTDYFQTSFTHHNMETVINLGMYLFNDPDEAVVRSAWYSMNLVFSDIMKIKQKYHYIGHVNRILTSITEDSQETSIEVLQGFICVDKASKPFSKMFTSALRLSRKPELLEQAAEGLALIVKYTLAKKLSKTIITEMVGALVEKSTHRLPWQVHAALLRLSNLILQKCDPKSLRTLTPHLQKISIRMLQNGHKLVRQLAAKSVSSLTLVSTVKATKLVSELHKALTKLDAAQVKDLNILGITESILESLTYVVQECGASIKAKNLLAVIDNVAALAYYQRHEGILNWSSQCLGAIVEHVSSLSLSLVFNKSSLNNLIAQDSSLTASSLWAADSDFEILRQDIRLKIIIANGVVQRAMTAEDSSLEFKEVLETLEELFSSESFDKIDDELLLLALSMTGSLIQLICILKSKKKAVNNGDSMLTTIMSYMNTCIISKSQAIRVKATEECRTLAKTVPDTVDIFPLVQNLLIVSRDRYAPVRLNVEWTILYLFNLRGGNHQLEKYFGCYPELIPSQVKYIRDYCARVLRRIGDEYDSEDEEDY